MSETQTCFDRLLTALQATGIPFAAFGWDSAPRTAYGVLSLDGPAASVRADNDAKEYARSAVVDLFDVGFHATNAILIENVLRAADYLSWYFEACTVDEADERIIHWQWIVELEAL